jgi:hypothetical protein
MDVKYVVPWIEVEYGWGERDEGYVVFDNLEQCKKKTLDDSENGNYESGGGYFGPVRPLHYYETTDYIEGPFPKFVKTIKFKSDIFYIKS